MSRLLYSRSPDDWEKEIIKEYVEEMMAQGFDLQQHFFYVELDASDGAVEIIRYPEESVFALAKILECTNGEALWCCGNFPGFANDLREMLYWNDIDGYRKYIVTTKTFNQNKELTYHEATLYSQSKEKAHEEFTMLGFVVHKIEDVDD